MKLYRNITILIPLHIVSDKFSYEAELNSDGRDIMPQKPTYYLTLNRKKKMSETGVSHCAYLFLAYVNVSLDFYPFLKLPTNLTQIDHH